MTRYLARRRIAVRTCCSIPHPSSARGREGHMSQCQQKDNVCQCSQRTEEGGKLGSRWAGLGRALDTEAAVAAADEDETGMSMTRWHMATGVERVSTSVATFADG